MFSLQDGSSSTGLPTRRELLRIGGLTTAGLSLPRLLQAQDPLRPAVPMLDKTFGKAKNIIFLYLTGGPPQHETFDPKPNAPVEVRGPFKPISTTIPGIQFCELLPRTAQIAHKLAVVRTMATDDNVHSSSGHWVLSGTKYSGPNARTLQPTDWPYFGSVIKRYKPSDSLPPLSTVWIPDINRLNENVTPAGQTGGLMGSEWDPDRFVGDPSQGEYNVEGLKLGRSKSQIAQRRNLLKNMELEFEGERRGPDVKLFGKYQAQAFDLLTSGRAQEAFAINREPDKVRQRYGMNRWGQCVLLARRLIESGVRMVHVQWPREPGDNAVDNPLWDTHAQNADRLEDVLCPMFDVGYSALIRDLDERGLLDETLVVAIGEFGRTPKINAKGGRDHWGRVFSCALAGAGISGGQTYGVSDKQGGHPIEDKVHPGELTATMFHLIGLDYSSTFRDRTGQEHKLTQGNPLFKLLGTAPATNERSTSNGSLARVPPYDPSILLAETGFAKADSLRSIDSPSRPKGWRATPLQSVEPHHGLATTLDKADACLGLNPTVAATPAAIAPGASALISQEVKSPFAGTYTLKVWLRAESSTPAIFKKLFQNDFTVRMEFFSFTKRDKNATQRKPLVSLTVDPSILVASLESTDYHQIELKKTFTNPNPGQNFSFGPGLGIAIIIEKSSNDTLAVNLNETTIQRVRINQVALTFQGKERLESVKV